MATHRYSDRLMQLVASTALAFAFAVTPVSATTIDHSSTSTASGSVTQKGMTQAQHQAKRQQQVARKQARKCAKWAHKMERSVKARGRLSARYSTYCVRPAGATQAGGAVDTSTDADDELIDDVVEDDVIEDGSDAPVDTGTAGAGSKVVAPGSSPPEGPTVPIGADAIPDAQSVPEPGTLALLALGLLGLGMLRRKAIVT